jgi:dihydrodipicolinate synthase/N-acetylneuraminate lyase
MAIRKSLISAVGSALRPDGSIHQESMRRHLLDQWANGMTGVLVGGTMGLMQLLSDRAYRQLVTLASDRSLRGGEVMIGVGDASFSRTRDRILFLNRHDVDGLVLLSPWGYPKARIFRAFFVAKFNFRRNFGRSWKPR